MQNMRNNKKVIFITIIFSLVMAGVACNLFTTTEATQEPIVEATDVPQISEEIEEDIWVPELLFRWENNDIVNSVAFSHDGTMFAAGFYMQTNIWNASDKNLLYEIEMDHSVEDLEFLPDNQSVASGVTLGGVKIYSISTGELIREFHGGYNNFLAVSPDGSLIATGNRSGITWLWRMADGELIAEMDPADYQEEYSEYIRSLAFSPDGGIIAAGHYDGSVFLWDVETNDLIHTLKINDDFSASWDVAFSPDGQYLAVGGASVDFEDFIAIWDVANGETVYLLSEYRGPGSMNAPVEFSPDGKLLAAGSVDGIYVWSLPSFELIHYLPIEETDASDWVTDLTFSPDSLSLLVSYWGGYVDLWQIQQSE